MSLILDFLKLTVCVLVAVGNLIMCASLSGCSFKDSKETFCEFFENRNVFGYILNAIILIVLVPGIIAGIIFRLLVLCIKGIWELGNR